VTVDQFRHGLRHGNDFLASDLRLYHDNPELALAAARAEIRWNGDEIALRRSCFVLSELGTDADAQLAIPLLRDQRPHVRAAAISVVPKLPNAVSTPLVEQLLYDQVAFVRERALDYFAADRYRHGWGTVLARFVFIAGEIKEFAPQVARAKQLIDRE
jgi:hypothetical protein